MGRVQDILLNVSLGVAPLTSRTDQLYSVHNTAPHPAGLKQYLKWKLAETASQIFVHLPANNHDKLNRRKRGLFILGGMVLGALLGLQTQNDAEKKKLQNYSGEYTGILDA